MILKVTFAWTPQEILDARDRYRQNSAEMQRERAVFDSGRKIAAGEIAPGCLDAITDWKTPRPKSRIKNGNRPAEIAEALRVATGAEQVRTAVGVLCGLDGVGVPVASAILSTIHPRRYTVIDWRALKALGIRKSWLTIDDYLQYLGFCKQKAVELGVSLRELDQALWILGGE